MSEVTDNSQIETTEVDAELAALMADLDEETTTEAAEPEVLEASEDELEEAMVTLDIEESENAKAEAAAKTQKAKAAKKEAKSDEKPKQKRVSTADLKVSEAVTLVTDGNMDLLNLVEGETMSDGDRQLYMDALDGIAKKQGQKVVNLFKWMAKGTKLKKFTDQAIGHIIAEGRTDSTKLREFFTNDCGYGAKTASSQASQFMNLLPFLMIASKDGKEIVLNDKSAIVAKFKAAKS